VTQTSEAAACISKGFELTVGYRDETGPGRQQDWGTRVRSHWTDGHSWAALWPKLPYTKRVRSLWCKHWDPSN